MGVQSKEEVVTNRVTKMYFFKWLKMEVQVATKIETNRVILGPIGGFVWVGIRAHGYLSRLIRI